jgi:hypothetical protein
MNIIITIKIIHVAQQDEKKAICFVGVLNTFAKGFQEIKRSESDVEGPEPGAEPGAPPAAAEPGAAEFVCAGGKLQLAKIGELYPTF